MNKEELLKGIRKFQILEDLKNIQNNSSNLSDDIVNTYTCMKEDPIKVISILDKLEFNHAINPAHNFYRVWTLNRTTEWIHIDKFYKAARFIYINNPNNLKWVN